MPGGGGGAVRGVGERRLPGGGGRGWDGAGRVHDGGRAHAPRSPRCLVPSPSFRARRPTPDDACSLRIADGPQDNAAAPDADRGPPAPFGPRAAGAACPALLPLRPGDRPLPPARVPRVRAALLPRAVRGCARAEAARSVSGRGRRVLMAWDFTTRFGRIVQVSPFALEDLVGALCSNADSPLLSELFHALLAHLLAFHESEGAAAYYDTEGLPLPPPPAQPEEDAAMGEGEGGAAEDVVAMPSSAMLEEGGERRFAQ
eukprot:3279062-Rhodomonas_salina.1